MTGNFNLMIMVGSGKKQNEELEDNFVLKPQRREFIAPRQNSIQNMW